LCKNPGFGWKSQKLFKGFEYFRACMGFLPFRGKTSGFLELLLVWAGCFWQIDGLAQFFPRCLVFPCCQVDIVPKKRFEILWYIFS
jgi:hypothetical protein